MIGNPLGQFPTCPADVGFALAFNARTATDARSELGARFDRLLCSTPAQRYALTSAGAELRLANGVTLLAKFDGEFDVRGHRHDSIRLVTSRVTEPSPLTGEAAPRT